MKGRKMSKETKQLIMDILVAKDAEYNFETAMRNKFDNVNSEMDAEVEAQREELPEDMPEDEKRERIPDPKHYELATTGLFQIPENLGNAILVMVGVDIENTLVEPDDVAYYESVITTVYQHNQDIEARADRILSLAGDREFADCSSLIANAKEAATEFPNSREYKEQVKPENWTKVVDALNNI